MAQPRTQYRHRVLVRAALTGSDPASGRHGRHRSTTARRDPSLVTHPDEPSTIAVRTSEQYRHVVHEVEQLRADGQHLSFEAFHASERRSIQPAVLRPAPTVGLRLHDRRFINPATYVAAWPTRPRAAGPRSSHPSGPSTSPTTDRRSPSRPRWGSEASSTRSCWPPARRWPHRAGGWGSACPCGPAMAAASASDRGWWCRAHRPSGPTHRVHPAGRPSADRRSDGVRRARPAIDRPRGRQPRVRGRRPRDVGIVLGPIAGKLLARTLIETVVARAPTPFDPVR